MPTQDGNWFEKYCEDNFERQDKAIEALTERVRIQEIMASKAFLKLIGAAVLAGAVGGALGGGVIPTIVQAILPRIG